MAHYYELSKLLSLQLLVVAWESQPPLLEVVHEVVKALLGRELDWEVRGAAATAHSDYVDGNLIEFIAHILKNLEVESSRSTKTVIVDNSITAVLPLPRNDCSNVYRLILLLVMADDDLQNSVFHELPFNIVDIVPILAIVVTK